MWNREEAQRTLMAVMPSNSQASIEIDKKSHSDLVLRISGKKVRARCVLHANLAAVKDAVALTPEPEIILLPRSTPAIREFLEKNLIGWVDQMGSAQITTDSLIISRDKIRVQDRKNQERWTRSMLGVAEALLTGTPATVSEVSAKTKLAASSTADALRALSKLNLLSASADRGRSAGRKITSYSDLLSAYAEATTTRPQKFALRVGVLWQDPMKSLADIGRIWSAEGIKWAATSAIAAAELAPFGTQIAPLEIFVDKSSPASMLAALSLAGLKPLDGGRLLVSPFPSEGTLHQVRKSQSIPTVPWPRVYADLQHTGVRGEELAEHLREKMELTHGE